MPRPVYPTFAPLADGTPRPFWSVMIPTYNRTTYLERTLRSVLEQAPGADEMQITVVDNASSDPTVETMVREVGGDRIEFVRQPINLGMVGNWNSCLQHARGYWVHILHDDDMVRPGFYAAYRQFIEAHPEVGLVFSRSLTIDESDEWKQILSAPPEQDRTGLIEDSRFRMITTNNAHFMRCPAVVVARRAYETVGGFDANAVLTVDWQMWIRVAAAFPAGYIHKPLSLYREHNQSATDTLVRNKDLIGDINRTLNIGIALLPVEQRTIARHCAAQICAEFSMFFRGQMHNRGYHGVALRYARRLYHFDRSFLNLMLLFKSLCKRMQAGL